MNVMVETRVELETFYGNFDNGRPIGKKYYQVGRYWTDPKSGEKKCLYGDFFETLSKREAKNWAKELLKMPKEMCVFVEG